ncbi:MAG: ABC transporter permease [Chitinophagales bacterium]|nr:MAG: ABC transporter permease [Chitinophagales bacterium]
MNWLLNVQLAFRAIRGNILRASLTIAIIAIGIMALVGILTAIESIKSSIVINLSSMGANTFTIRTKGLFARGGRSGEVKDHLPVTYEQAITFKERYRHNALVSVNTRASSTAQVKFGQKKTNPNVTVMGVDENYLIVSSYKLKSGRNFSRFELQTGFNVCILGSGVVKHLFDAKDTIENKEVSLGNVRYKVIGILEEKGASMVGSDNVVLVTVQNARKVFPASVNKYAVSVAVDDPEALEPAIDEARGLFRNIRRLSPAEEDDFDISRSDKLATTVIDNLRYVTMAATVIGIVTLIAAGIGLMNIMLVAVAERTREIGISKAIGATNRIIKAQFLTESVVICQLGGIFGIILGVIAGNLVSLFLKGTFIVPWLWVSGGFAFCFLVGLAAGLYPAVKASRLDPIEALRYE